MSDSEKHSFAADILVEGHTLRVLIDATKPKVVVPVRYLNRPDLCLEVGYETPVPIPDFVVNSRGFYGTLSFNGVPAYVNIPWGAVYVLKDVVTASQRIWREDTPLEALQAALDQKKKLAPVIDLVEYRKRKARP